MANHKSAIKRIRQTKTKNLKNRLQHKTTRNAIKVLKETTTKKEAEKQFTNVTSLLDKLAKNNVIHKNKSANLKSKLSKHINSLKSVKKAKTKAKSS
jgi:small subunit ribosomal protein S20